MVPPRIAVYGDNCLDVYERPERARFVGGNAVNVAVHLASLGASTAYLGVVGDDEAGALIRQSIETRGVDCSRVDVHPGESAVTWIEVRDGERIVLGDRVGVQCPQTLSPEAMEMICDYPLIHASAYTAWNISWWEACPRIVEEVATFHSAGAAVSLDFSELVEPELASLCGRDLGIAFVSRGDGCGERALDETLGFFHECGIPEVVVTLGAAGSVYSGGGKRFHVAARPIEPVDTLGAGDAFIAGWLFERGRGESARQSMKTATTVAAEVCGYFGAWPQV